MRLQSIQDEGIDLIGRSVGTFDIGRRLAPNGLKRPPGSLRWGRLEGRRRSRCGFRGWPGRPRCHPALECGDLAGRELLLRRHLRFVEVAHRPDERALIRGVRDDSRSTLSAFQERRSVRQPEAGLCFLLSVARLTFLDDQGANRFLEEGGRRRVIGMCRECLKRELKRPDNKRRRQVSPANTPCKRDRENLLITTLLARPATLRWSSPGQSTVVKLLFETDRSPTILLDPCNHKRVRDPADATGYATQRPDHGV